MTLTQTKPTAEADIEVFTRTPEQLRGETCDSCGKAVPARYVASKENSELYFCAHHIRKHHDKLKEQNFDVFPEDISYTAGVSR